MSKILIWINTFNREKMLESLLKNIEEQKNKHTIDMFIFNDSSIDDYENVRLNKLVKLFYNSNKHYGKEYYWKFINRGLYFIKSYKNDYDLYIKTDDDMLLCDGFFDLCLENWKSLYHPKLFTLDILSIPRQRGRTLKGERLSLKKIGKHNFYKTNWVDMNFIFNPKAFEEIQFQIKDCRQGRNSSGVGLWLTNTFNKLGYEMYQTPVSFLIHKNHPSKMNSEVRNKVSLITQGLK